MNKTTNTALFSEEYLGMPKRKERALGYIRESDITLADSTTIESQAKAVRQYCEKMGYNYDPSHEFREAIGAYDVHYMQRKALLQAIDACKRGEVDTFVVSEIRAFGRKQVEIFVLYDILQKYGVRLETTQGPIENTAIGRHILATYALVAELERENTYSRLQRGRRDRIEIGNAPTNGQPCYGYVLVDSARETNALYRYNTTVIYVDSTGTEWSEHTVVHYIFALLKQGLSLRAVAIRLNDIGIPPPKKATKKQQPIWNARAISRMLDNPTYTGKVYANRYKHVKGRVYPRPVEEWILLPDPAPAYIEEDTVTEIKQRIAHNRQDSPRNNKHEELGLLRSYIYCGICGKRMHVVYPSPAGVKRRNTPLYRCEAPYGKNLGTVNYHRTQIHMKFIDDLGRAKIVEVLNHPEQVRAQVEQWRKENRETVDPGDIETTVGKITAALKNLYRLAEDAPDDEELARITSRMQELGKQKREAEAMLYTLEEDKEEREAIEKELVRFEGWVAKVRPYLTDPAYLNTASYDELRMAIHILGITATIYPTQGEWPFRHEVVATVPEVRKVATLGPRSSSSSPARRPATRCRN